MTIRTQAIDPAALAEIQADAQAVIDTATAAKTAADARAKADAAMDAAMDKLTQAQQKLSAAVVGAFGSAITFTYGACTFVYVDGDKKYIMTPIPPVLTDLGAGP
jgi:aspartate aminotransferase-like enzyme